MTTQSARQLHDARERLRLDGLICTRLSCGNFRRYLRNMPIAGLTSNPTIFRANRVDERAAHKRAG